MWLNHGSDLVGLGASEFWLCVVSVMLVLMVDFDSVVFLGGSGLLGFLAEVGC